MNVAEYVLHSPDVMALYVTIDKIREKKHSLNISWERIDFDLSYNPNTDLFTIMLKEG